MNNLNIKSLPVKDYMTSDIVTVYENEKVDGLGQLLKRRSIHHLIVLNEKNELSGIISSEDVARADTMILGDKLTAKHIMVTQLTFLFQDEPLDKALKIFLKNRFRALPIMNEKECVGIITPFDLLNLIQ